MYGGCHTGSAQIRRSIWKHREREKSIATSWATQKHNNNNNDNHQKICQNDKIMIFIGCFELVALDNFSLSHTNIHTYSGKCVLCASSICINTSKEWAMCARLSDYWPVWLLLFSSLFNALAWFWIYTHTQKRYTEKFCSFLSHWQELYNNSH